MYKFRTLENVDVKIIHEAFVKAFSDYQVKMDLPLWKFQQMLVRRGFAPEKSIGAFKDDYLVGFILNGYREWKGKPTIYDLGTGVVPKYRKQGLTTNMFLKIVELFKTEEVEQYLLEVLQENTSAYELYKKQGFEITRAFTCYKLDKAQYRPIKTYEIEHVDRFSADEWEQVKLFWDFQPSWQNSVDSINALSEAFVYSIVRVDGKIAGYGVIDKKTGDIPQLGVDKSLRRKGIARSIMTDLINNTEANNIFVLNVENQASTVKNFLSSLGFAHYTDQYEMLLDLKRSK